MEGPIIDIQGYDSLELVSERSVENIYRGRHTATLTEVAIKALDIPIKDRVRQERLRREALALGCLDHDGVVKIREHRVQKVESSSEKPHILVMEWVDGRSLEEVLWTDHVPGEAVPEWLIDTFAKLAGALNHCHERGILHRDVKPSNIMIRPVSRDPVLIDFGFARLDPERVKADISTWESLTETGQAVGTPLFMSPEQFFGKKTRIPLTPAADVWGFGASLYYCLSGVGPFTAHTLMELYDAFRKKTPMPIKYRCAKVPDWLADLCMACLEKDPNRRPRMADIAKIMKARGGRLNINKQQPKSNSTPKILGCAALFLTATMALLGSMDSNQSKPSKFVALQVPKRVRVGACNISGTLQGASKVRVVRVGQNWQKTLPINKDGSFAFSVLLNDGKHPLRIEALDSKETVLLNEELEVICDDSPPRLTFKPVAGVQYGEETHLQGTISELATVTVGGVTSKLSKGFDLVVPLSLGKNRLSITCRDAVGLESVRTLFVERRAAFCVGLSKDQQSPGEESFESFELAYRMAMPHTRITLGPGVYKGHIALDKSIVLRGQSKLGKVILEGRADEPCLTIAAPECHLEGLSISGGAVAVRVKEGALFAKDCSFEAKAKAVEVRSTEACVVEFTDCEFSGSGEGVSLLGPIKFSAKKCAWTALTLALTANSPSVRALLEECSFDGNERGISFQAGALLCKNTVLRRQKEGAVIINGVATATLERCTIKSNGRIGRAAAVSFKAGGSGVLQNCEVLMNLSHGVELTDSGEVQIRDSRVSQNSGWGVRMTGSKCTLKGLGTEFQSNGNESRSAGGVETDGGLARLGNCQIKNNMGYGVRALGRGRIELSGGELGKNSLGDEASVEGGIVRKL